jgi:hypothetical protein
MRIFVDYAPTEKQRLFHMSDADEVLYGGAAGGGKSKAVVMDAFSRCMRHPHTHAYLFRRTYPELRDSLIKEALMSIPPALRKWSSSTHDMKLPNESGMHFRYCRNLQDALFYYGTEIHWLYIDELTHFEREVYNKLKSRVRAAKWLNIRPRIRCTANPGGPGHGWVKAYFITIGEPFKKHEREIKSTMLGATQMRTIQYIPAYVTDNPYVSEDYVYQLEQLPLKIRKALLFGDWDVFEGQVFMEWRDDPEHYVDRKWTHVIEPFKIPKSWRRWRSFDFGYARPFSVGWWAMDNDGAFYRYDELYGWDGTPNVGCKWHPPQIAQEIKRIEQERRDHENIIGIADPSIFDDSRGDSIAKQMAREGIRFREGDNSRIDGKMQLHYRLSFGEDGYPLIYIFNWCRNFIRTVPELTYDEKHPEDVDTDGEDHIYDETRYMIQEHPVPARENFMDRKPFNPLAVDRTQINKFLSM